MGITQIKERAITSLRPYARNARTHSKKQVRQIAASIERFGFTNPVLISDEGEIIAGHGRVEAAKLLKWKTVPTIALSHLSETERRAYVLADNKLALNAGWDKEIVAIELQALVDLEFDVEVTGFSLAEVDLVIDEAGEADPDGTDAPEDAVAFATGTPISQTGDIWHLGRHRLLCGDARSARDFEALMNGEKADLVFTDPPYNVKIDGNVCGLGSVKHREFAFASGEMNRAQFTAFLSETLGNVASVRGPLRGPDDAGGKAQVGPHARVPRRAAGGSLDARGQLPRMRSHEEAADRAHAINGRVLGTVHCDVRPGERATAGQVQEAPRGQVPSSYPRNDRRERRRMTPRPVRLSKTIQRQLDRVAGDRVTGIIKA